MLTEVLDDYEGWSACRCSHLEGLEGKEIFLVKTSFLAGVRDVGRLPPETAREIRNKRQPFDDELVVKSVRGQWGKVNGLLGEHLRRTRW